MKEGALHWPPLLCPLFSSSFVVALDAGDDRGCRWSRDRLHGRTKLSQRPCTQIPLERIQGRYEASLSTLTGKPDLGADRLKRVVVLIAPQDDVVLVLRKSLNRSLDIRVRCKVVA